MVSISHRISEAQRTALNPIWIWFGKAEEIKTARKIAQSVAFQRKAEDAFVRNDGDENGRPTSWSQLAYCLGMNRSGVARYKGIGKNGNWHAQQMCSLPEYQRILYILGIDYQDAFPPWHEWFALVCEALVRVQIGQHDIDSRNFEIFGYYISLAREYGVLDAAVTRRVSADLSGESVDDAILSAAEQVGQALCMIEEGSNDD